MCLVLVLGDYLLEREVFFLKQAVVGHECFLLRLQTADVGLECFDVDAAAFSTPPGRFTVAVSYLLLT